MLTLEQAINDLMDASRTIAEVAESESDEANRINAQNVADDCKQIAELLCELQERRKEPKRVKGRWIEILSYKNHTYKCSECGRLLVNVTDGRNNVSKHYPYCHCGADMNGEPNEVRTP